MAAFVKRKCGFVPNQILNTRQLLFLVTFSIYYCTNYVVEVVECKTEPVTFCLPYPSSEESEKVPGRSSVSESSSVNKLVDQVQISGSVSRIMRGKNSRKLYLCTTRSQLPKQKILELEPASNLTYKSSNISTTGSSKRNSRKTSEESYLKILPTSVDHHYVINKNPFRRSQLLQKLRRLMRLKRLRSHRQHKYQENAFSEHGVNGHNSQYNDHQNQHGFKSHDSQPSFEFSSHQNQTRTPKLNSLNSHNSAHQNGNQYHSSEQLENHQMMKPEHQNSTGEMSHQSTEAQPSEKFLAASILAVIVSGIGVLFLTIVAYVGLIVQNKVPRREEEKNEESSEDGINVEKIKKGLYNIHFHFAEEKEKESKKKKKEREEKARAKEKAEEIMEFVREVIAVDAYSHHLGAANIGLVANALEAGTGNDPPRARTNDKFNKNPTDLIKTKKTQATNPS